MNWACKIEPQGIKKPIRNPLLYRLQIFRSTKEWRLMRMPVKRMRVDELHFFHTRVMSRDIPWLSRNSTSFMIAWTVTTTSAQLQNDRITDLFQFHILLVIKAQKDFEEVAESMSWPNWKEKSALLGPTANQERSCESSSHTQVQFNKYNPPQYKPFPSSSNRAYL